MARKQHAHGLRVEARAAGDMQRAVEVYSAVLQEAPENIEAIAGLADLLFEKVGLNKREAKDMVETFFDEISAALASRKRGSTTFHLRSSVAEQAIAQGNRVFVDGSVVAVR